MPSSAALDFALADVVPVELAVEGTVDLAHQPPRDRCDRLVGSPMTRLATSADVGLVRRRADAVVVVWLVGRRGLAVAARLGTLIKPALERVVKAVVSRQRPAASILPGIHFRGDVPVSGESFASGHAVMVAALASGVAPSLPERWHIAPSLALGVVVTTRVYVGAHSPLDVLCGAALGLAIGGGVKLLLGVPEPSR